MNGMNNINLSIIIPTFNGGTFLNESLEYLIPMLKRYSEGDIEFILSNNGSEDNTDDVVRCWQKEYPNLVYINRPVNIGSMANFEDATFHSRGKFVLLLGDDDILVPGSIDYLMGLLHDYPDISLLHWNRIDYKMVDYSASLFNSKINKFLDYSERPEEFLRKHATMDSMSTVIFRRECWAEISKDKEEKYWGYTWYAKILYGALQSGRPALYSSFPLVIQRHPIVRKWSAKRPLYVAGLLNIYKDLDCLAPGIYNYYNNNYPANCDMFFLTMLNIIAENKKLYKSYKNELYAHNKSIWRRVLLFLTLYVNPIWVTRLLVLLNKVVIKLIQKMSHN